MAIINDGVTIDSGLEASVMRRKMESKDTLATKGALYVGTGTKKDSFTVTKSIAPNGSSDNGKVLVADSNEIVGWTISDTCPKAKAVTTDIGTQKITDIFESDGKTAKSATIAKGLQSNTAQTANGTNWYEFNGTNEYFGSTGSPTIVKTSEARLKAEVKSGAGTVTKEIALEEDIPRVGEWVTVTGDTATLTEAGTYQVIAGVTDMQSIVYWDGKTQAYGTRNTLPLVTTMENPVLPSIYCAYPHIDSNGELSVQYYYISMRWDNSAYVWYKTNISKFSGFKYRKINYKE
jgi:hypothetical protein